MKRKEYYLINIRVENFDKLLERETVVLRTTKSKVETVHFDKKFLLLEYYSVKYFTYSVCIGLQHHKVLWLSVPWSST